MGGLLRVIFLGKVGDCFSFVGVVVEGERGEEGDGTMWRCGKFGGMKMEWRDCFAD